VGVGADHFLADSVAEEFRSFTLPRHLNGELVMNRQWSSGYWIADNQATWDERAEIHLRDANGFYAVERFRRGEDVMLAIESAEIGNVAGRHLLHLQCHIGLETLCLARRGAMVTGLDFSSAAIAAAQGLAAETGLKGLFVKADVYDALKVLEGGFDVVYVSWGSLNWLPDVWRWAEVVSGLLAPGGFLYLVEQHPFISIMKERDGRLEPFYAWRTPMEDPILTEAAATYTGDEARLANSRMHEWEHPLSDIITALLASGLRLEFLHEHELLPWRRLPMMVPAADRLYRLPDGQTRMPLAFSLKAWKARSSW
jgi:SAM-dependent methyltransferase